MGSITSLLGRYPRVAIVEIFSENPTEEYSVPEIVRESGISKRGAYIHIKRLLEEGVLKKSRKEGKGWYYRINENDARGQLLPFIESVFTIGRLEREIKRDEGIASEEPLEAFKPLWGRLFQLGANYEIDFPVGTASNVNPQQVGWTPFHGSGRKVRTDDLSSAKPFAAT